MTDRTGPTEERDWPPPTPEERRGFEAERRDDEERERLRDEGRWGARESDTPAHKGGS